MSILDSEQRKTVVPATFVHFNELALFVANNLLAFKAVNHLIFAERTR